MTNIKPLRTKFIRVYLACFCITATKSNSLNSQLNTFDVKEQNFMKILDQESYHWEKQCRFVLKSHEFVELPRLLIITAEELLMVTSISAFSLPTIEDVWIIQMLQHSCVFGFTTPSGLWFCFFFFYCWCSLFLIWERFVYYTSVLVSLITD